MGAPIRKRIGFATEADLGGAGGRIVGRFHGLRALRALGALGALGATAMHGLEGDPAANATDDAFGGETVEERAEGGEAGAHDGERCFDEGPVDGWGRVYCVNRSHEWSLELRASAAERAEERK